MRHRHPLRNRAVRVPRLLVVAAVTLGLLTVPALPAMPAGASLPQSSGIFTACGFQGAIPPGPTCTSLPQALALAHAYTSTATIELLPGVYCPPDLSNLTEYHDLRFIGVGAGDPPSSPNVGGDSLEVHQVQFLQGADCAPVGSALVTLPSTSQYQRVTFSNLTFMGGNPTAPAIGLDATNAHLILRDVQFENLTTGLRYVGDDLQVDSSAFVDNGVGVQFSGEGSIDQSTLSGNTVGVATVNGSIHLDNDTISHNTYGADVGYGGNTWQVANTINAGNTADCRGSSYEWESATFNSTNLLGSSCHADPNAGDIAYDSAFPIPDLSANGGPTMSIAPSSQAIGHGTAGLCGSTTVAGPALDQREFLKPADALCDIGAVQLGADGTPATLSSPADGSTTDLGVVVSGTSTGASVSLSNTGGGADYVTDVSTTGDAVLSYDSCSHAVMLNTTGFNSCAVTVRLAANAAGQRLGGSVEFSTSGGFRQVLFTANHPMPPTAVSGAARSNAVSLHWAPPSAGPAPTSYRVQYSWDTTSWFDTASSPTASTVVNALINGRPYYFRVASVDANTDVSDWSVASAAITPTAPTRRPVHLTTPSGSTLHYGDTVDLATVLTDAVTHAPLAGKRVALTRRYSATGTVTTAGILTTDSLGRAHLVVKPGRTTQYSWVAQGTATTAPGQSTWWTETVRPLVHVSATHRNLVATVYGRLEPATAGVVVQLQQSVSGHWREIGQGVNARQRMPDGTVAVGYKIIDTVRRATTQTLRTVALATTSMAAGVSRTFTLTLK